MPAVTVEKMPVQVMHLGALGFDHMQIVFRPTRSGSSEQDHWFVIEGLREPDAGGARLAVEGWHGGTTLSDANGGLAGAELAMRIGTQASRGARQVAAGREAMSLWATLVAHASDIETQRFPYIPLTLPTSPLPTINSSSLVASLLHRAGIDVSAALPTGLRLSPGKSTLLGTSGNDTMHISQGFTTLVGGDGDDVLIGRHDTRVVDKLFGGLGNDVFHWSKGINILHGGQPGLSHENDGIDTVDYTGAGHIRIEARSSNAPHVVPDFVVHHASGRDYLFSIEEIIWDGAVDRVTLGDGVGLAPLSPGYGKEITHRSDPKSDDGHCASSCDSLG